MTTNAPASVRYQKLLGIAAMEPQTTNRIVQIARERLAVLAVEVGRDAAADIAGRVGPLGSLPR